MTCKCIRSRLLAAFLILAPLNASAAAPPPQTAKVSTFGKYSGYSEAVYDGWVRTSRYVTARDGTRLAVDVFRPTRHGGHGEAAGGLDAPSLPTGPEGEREGVHDRGLLPMA